MLCFDLPADRAAMDEWLPPFDKEHGERDDFAGGPAEG